MASRHPCHLKLYNERAEAQRWAQQHERGKVSEVGSVRVAPFHSKPGAASAFAGERRPASSRRGLLHRRMASPRIRQALPRAPPGPETVTH